jgi:hypothetical protein
VDTEREGFVALELIDDDPPARGGFIALEHDEAVVLEVDLTAESGAGGLDLAPDLVDFDAVEPLLLLFPLWRLYALVTLPLLVSDLTLDALSGVETADARRV